MEADIQTFGEIGKQVSDATIFMHEAIARKAGLSGTDHKYLGLLIRNGPMTAGELSKLTGLTTGAVTGLIDRFEKKNLANRTFDKEDRRKIIIVPNTENALKLFGHTNADLRSKMTALISSLDEKEMEIIRKYMLSSIEIMKEVTDTLNNSFHE